jgi:hypothetical protein
MRSFLINLNIISVKRTSILGLVDAPHRHSWVCVLSTDSWEKKVEESNTKKLTD